MKHYNAYLTIQQFECDAENKEEAIEKMRRQLICDLLYRLREPAFYAWESEEEIKYARVKKENC